MQEDGFDDKDASWSYEGLRDLEAGDDFTVQADDGSVLLRGIIRRDTETGQFHVSSSGWTASKRRNVQAASS